MPQLAPNEIRRRAVKFAQNWKNEKRERAEKDTFWNEFFHIFGIERRRVAIFEYAVKKSARAHSFIDVFWKGRLLCEHKSAGENLEKAAIQAFEYLEQIEKIDPSELPRYVVVSDFARFRLWDIETDAVLEFAIEDLPNHWGSFQFMLGVESEVKAAEEQANIAAAEEIGALYDILRENGYEEHALKALLIRLLFCFFAEDTSIYSPCQFEHYIKNRTQPDGSDLGAKLNELFQILNTPEDRRMKNLDEHLAAFPYVNGKLFADYLPTAAFDSLMRDQLLKCCRRDWSKISPEIFGSLFQSVMNSRERRDLGAHYTEENNIRKVIDGLFLEQLKAEFSDGMKIRNKAQKHKILDGFHNKIANLTFLDPACGCGNFLVVAYRALRELELEIIAELYAENQLLDISTMIRCHIGQFHGIEIDEYPAQIAKVAMWLTDHQCNLAAAERFGSTRPSIPLNDSAVIANANALQTEWPQTDYILGNPPFIGSTYQNKEQKEDVKRIAGSFKGFANLDYVAMWYIKAAQIMAEHPHTQTAFVSTNSICQGEQVAILWGNLFKQNIEITFAHRTFQWTSAAKGKAAVHCVIVGFARTAVRGQRYADSGTRTAVRGQRYADSAVQGVLHTPLHRAKTLYFYPDIKGTFEPQSVANINPYLIDAGNIVFEKRKTVLSGEAEMVYGNKPADGGNFFLTTEEKNALIQAEPLAEQYIRPFLGADEFINGKERWCLWFNGVSDVKRNHDLQKMPQVRQRIENVRQMRLASTKAATQKDAEKPHLFTEIRQPESGNYLIIPRVSSETRRYIPIGFMPSEIINSDANFSLPNATLYHFGILCSTMHNAFMRITAGRLESRYRYSNTLVYNNFPFPFTASERENPSAETAKKIRAIENAAKAVLDARAQIADQARAENLLAPTLADLYSPHANYTALKAAHKKLDAAVDKAYRTENFDSEAERVGYLFDLYEKLKD